MSNKNGLGDEALGTDGRVYGGDPRLIHVKDGTRADFGIDMAEKLNRLMRENAENRTTDEKIDQRLCPGCYMVVGFNMMLILADANGQDRRELARSMIHAYEQLLANPDEPPLEEIFIQLDPPELCPAVGEPRETHFGNDRADEG